MDSFYEPELWRLRGQLFAAAEPGSPQALDCYQRALERARATGAALLELRAAVSIARVIAPAGEHDRARELVTSAIAKVRGGRDTVDYREAAALLDEIAA